MSMFLKLEIALAIPALNKKVIQTAKLSSTRGKIYVDDPCKCFCHRHILYRIKIDMQNILSHVVKIC